MRCHVGSRAGLCSHHMCASPNYLQQRRQTPTSLAVDYPVTVPATIRWPSPGLPQPAAQVPTPPAVHVCMYARIHTHILSPSAASRTYNLPVRRDRPLRRPSQWGRIPPIENFQSDYRQPPHPLLSAAYMPRGMSLTEPLLSSRRSLSPERTRAKETTIITKGEPKGHVEGSPRFRVGGLVWCQLLFRCASFISEPGHAIYTEPDTCLP